VTLSGSPVDLGAYDNHSQLQLGASDERFVFATAADSNFSVIRSTNGTAWTTQVFPVSGMSEVYSPNLLRKESGTFPLSTNVFAMLLSERPTPPDVRVKDFGIRGVHLVYELLDGCDLFVLIDAAQRGYPPGTVTVLEVEPEHVAEPGGVMDAHGLAPDQVFALLASMDSRPGRSLVVACEPADVSPGMGLSEQVRGALPAAVRAVEEIIQQKEGADNDVHAD